MVIAQMQEVLANLLAAHSRSEFRFADSRVEDAIDVVRLRKRLLAMSDRDLERSGRVA